MAGTKGGPRPDYGQYNPVARALDVLGDRWSLLILRDLLGGTTRFNDLGRAFPRLSRTLLANRLRQFEEAGLVDRVDGDYVLTRAGRAVEPVVAALAEWGAEFAFGDPDPDELEPRLLMWWVHSRLDPSVLPGGRTVVHFEFTDDRRGSWIVFDDGEVSLRNFDPGLEVDVTISTDIATLLRVWLGRVTLKDAQRDGRVEITGAPALVRRIPSLLLLSPDAPLVRAHT